MKLRQKLCFHPAVRVIFFTNFSHVTENKIQSCPSTLMENTTNKLREVNRIDQASQKLQPSTTQELVCKSRKEEISEVVLT